MKPTTIQRDRWRAAWGDSTDGSEYHEWLEDRLDATLAACRAMLAHLDRWLETGHVATAEESRRLYEQMAAAVAKANGG